MIKSSEAAATPQKLQNGAKMLSSKVAAEMPPTEQRPTLMKRPTFRRSHAITGLAHGEELHGEQRGKAHRPDQPEVDDHQRIRSPSRSPTDRPRPLPSCGRSSVGSNRIDPIVSEETPAGVRRMLADAEQRGLAVELRRRPAAHSIEEAADLLGIAPSDIAKTIVVRRPAGITCLPSYPAARRFPGPSCDCFSASAR
jgi:hypothetical protein